MLARTVATGSGAPSPCWSIHCRTSSTGCGVPWRPWRRPAAVAELGGVEAGGAAEGFEQFLALFWVPGGIPGRSRQTPAAARRRTGNRSVKSLLPAEQMQLHQQFIHHAPVEGRDHMGEGAMEDALAVGDGEGRRSRSSDFIVATIALLPARLTPRCAIPLPLWLIDRPNHRCRSP